MKSYPILFNSHISEESGEVGPNWLFNTTKQQASYERIYVMYLKYCEGLTLKFPANAGVYLDNLQRLRLVELGHDFLDGRKKGLFGLFMDDANADFNQKKNSIPARDEYLRMTAFGKSFTAACISKNA